MDADFAVGFLVIRWELDGHRFGITTLLIDDLGTLLGARSVLLAGWATVIIAVLQLKIRVLGAGNMDCVDGHAFLIGVAGELGTGLRVLAGSTGCTFSALSESVQAYCTIGECAPTAKSLDLESAE